jgi:hypothetical protein
MEPNDAIILLSMASVFLFTTTITFVGLWIRARERAIRAGAGAELRSANPTPDMEHLVNAVDAIAVEVERISEAQRFTAKVLAERTDAAPGSSRMGGAPERVITPH